LRDERDRLLRENEALRTQSGALAHDAAELAYWAGPEPRFVPPGHFASPVPSLDEVRAQATRLFGPPPRRIAGIDLDEAGRRSSTSNAGSAKTSEANDVLFIDSSHVGKAGSDVNCLLFDILPSLRSGVHVHFHDVLHPFEYPLDWFEAGRAFNEAYLVRAFLSFNEAFRIVLFNTFLEHFHECRFAERMPLCLRNTGGSLWVARR